MEFTPASESGKSTQSSEYQSAAVVQVHDSKLNGKSEQQGEIINDHILENMPHKDIALQSKSDRHMLQGLGVRDKLSCAGRSQDEVLSEKNSYGHNVRNFSDKKSLMEVDNFTQNVANCMKTCNTDENADSSCFSQNSCHGGTDVCSGSHDDSLNEEDTALVGTEHNAVKLKVLFLIIRTVLEKHLKMLVMREMKLMKNTRRKV